MRVRGLMHDDVQREINSIDKTHEIATICYWFTQMSNHIKVKLSDINM